MGKYSLICSADGAPTQTEHPFDFTGSCHDNALLKPLYEKRKIEPDLSRPGLWKYLDWLPVKDQNEYPYGPVTYKSEGLARELGLKDLWISFNGYYPDFGAYYKTCTFKELHAVLAIQYARENGVGKMVLASAGNTAVAFTYIAEVLKFPVVCIVPEKCMCGVNVPNMLIDYAKIVMLKGDYSDALDISKRLCKVKNYVYEGGAKNFARRAGLAVPYLDAVLTIGNIPTHYFQAVGSGTGAAAAWHVNELLIRDGSYGSHYSRLHLSQNTPMTPMVSAWSAGRNYINLNTDIPKIDNILDALAARVLSTKYPAYEIRGGVHDALKATGGLMYAIKNEEVYESGDIFRRTEGRDILPASCVAVSSLRRAVKEKKVRPDDIILLNITGGGIEQRLRDLSVLQIKPNASITSDITDDQLERLDV